MILTVLFYGFSIKTASAKGAVQAVQEAFKVIPIPQTVKYVALFLIHPLAAAYTQTAMISGAIGAKVFPCNETAAGILGNFGGAGMGGGPGGPSGGAIAVELVKNNNCDGGSTSSDQNGAGAGASPTPWQGAAGSPTLQNQTASPAVSSDGNCVTGFTLSYNATDAYQYGIYRDGNLINQGTLNTIVQPSPYNTSFSYTDSNLAPNITYKYMVVLTDKNGGQYKYPELLAYTDCIKLDLKANDTDGPLNVFVAKDNVNLRWDTIAAASCTASGDWSGNKGPSSASQDLGRIARGISNPGKGKQYNYSMSCEFPQKNKTLSDSVQVTVFKYPDCVFSADPSTIEVLPATSTLSWDCRYVGGEADEGSDSCSIDQSVGNVNPIFGSASVRPSQATTYTLTCSAADGTISYQTSVNIGFKPRVYEVIPSY